MPRTGGETATAGGVHNQQHPAAKIPQAHAAAIQQRSGKRIEVWRRLVHRLTAHLTGCAPGPKAQNSPPAPARRNPSGSGRLSLGPTKPVTVHEDRLASAVIRRGGVFFGKADFRDEVGSGSWAHAFRLARANASAGLRLRGFGRAIPPGWAGDPAGVGRAWVRSNIIELSVKKAERIYPQI